MKELEVIETIEDLEEKIISLADNCSTKGNYVKITFPLDLIDTMSHKQYGMSKVDFMREVVLNIKKHYGDKCRKTGFSYGGDTLTVNFLFNGDKVS